MTDRSARSRRLPALTPDQLSEVRRRLYDDIVSGPRARSFGAASLLEADGSLTGPFDAMLHSPSAGRALQALGSSLRYGGVLSDRERELATLTVAVTVSSGYEWYAHAEAALAAGLSPAELDAVRAGENRSLADSDLDLVTACRLLCTQSDLPDDLYARLATRYSNEWLVELVILVGYYRTLALLLAAFAVPMPLGVADPLADGAGTS